MNKLIIILTLILFIFSCQKQESLNERFKFLNTKEENNAKIDFSKNGLELIKNIENQINKDFCNSSSYLNGIITKNKEDLSFPLVIYKYCNTFVHFRNRISIIVNAKNEVLIEEEFIVKPTRKLQNDLIKVTEEFDNRNNKNIVYLLDWDTKIDSNIMIDRLLEIFTAAKILSNKLSLEMFKKQINDLNQSELTELKKIYNPIIGIEQGIIIDSD